MKKLLPVLATMSTLTINAADTDTLTHRLDSISDFSAIVDVELTLPMAANDEVHYSLKLASREAANDSLSRIDYLVDWTLPSPSGESHGFASYFDGNFYRFRDGGGRLQEYHASLNADPFLSGTPLQRTAQFYEALPAAISQEIKDMVQDTTTYRIIYIPDTIHKGVPVAVFKAKRLVNDYEAGNYTYIFDKNSFFPIIIEKEMSPGTISEQTVTYTYSYGNDMPAIPTSEAELIELYPEAFAKFREGTYALNSLKMRPLNSFALPTLSGDRFMYNRNESLASPTVIAFLDESVSSTPDVIVTIRNTIRQLPANVDVIWIFLSNRHEEIEETVNRTLSGEKTLISGRNIVQEFGITETPSFLLITPEGVIKDVMAGYNNNLPEFVISIL